VFVVCCVGSDLCHELSPVFVVCCVGSDLCHELITRAEESHLVCVCLILCDLETSKMGRPRPEFGCCATEKEM
jgi:hypothetical protein